MKGKWISAWAPIALLVAATAPVKADQLLFLFSTPTGLLGNTQAYGSMPNVVTLYGFNGTSNSSQNNPTALYGKAAGGDENGVGLSLDAADHEIQTSDFVQVDFSQVHALNVTTVQFMMGSSQTGEGWTVFGSNTKGLIGTPLSSAATGWGTADATLMTLPNFTYTYYSFSASAGNVELSEVQINYNASSAPEPGTYLLVGAALLALARVGKASRRRR